MWMETYCKWQITVNDKIAHFLQYPAWKSFPKACCHWPWRTLGGCDICFASLQLVNIMMSKTRRLETSISNIGEHTNRKWWQVMSVLQYSLFKCWEGKNIRNVWQCPAFKTGQRIGNAIFLHANHVFFPSTHWNKKSPCMAKPSPSQVQDIYIYP